MAAEEGQMDQGGSENRLSGESGELKLAEGQLATFFNHAPIGISWREVDEHGQPGANHVNARFCEIIGMSREEALDIRNVMRATHPEDRLKQIELTREVYAGRRDRFALEKRYIHKDGKAVWANLTVAVLRNEAGRVTHHFAMLEDITARRAAEQELRNSERRWRNYLHTSSEILYALTTDLEYKFLSRAWTRKLGHPVDAALGRSFFDFVHPDDADACRGFIEAVVNDEPRPDHVEYRAKHFDGSWLWHASAGSRYVDQQGMPSFFGVARDITLRRRAQEELKAALARREELERIIDRSPSVVVLFRSENGQWPTEYVSASVRQFGYEPGLFTDGKLNFMDIVHEDDRERVSSELEAHAAAHHDEYKQEYRIRCPDGRVRWIDDHTLVRRNEHGRATHHEGVLTDISERKEAEEVAREVSERELRMAREVQQHLLPSDFPDIGACEVQAMAQASGQLGGDYYDAFPVGEGRYGLAIADVSGKGAPAALMMSACRASLRLIAQGEASPAKVMRLLNARLVEDMPPRMFITLFYGVFDPASGELSYCRAGHEPALVLRSGECEPGLLQAGGMALGMAGGELFDGGMEEGNCRLRSGDMLALYTDGVTEAVNAHGEEFGRQRMIDALCRYSDQPLEAALARLDRHLRRFSALDPMSDDRTVLLLRVG